MLTLARCDLHVSLVRDDNKFATEKLLFMSSMLLCRDPVHHLQCKFSLTVFIFRLGKFPALWAQWGSRESSVMKQREIMKQKLAFTPSVNERNKFEHEDTQVKQKIDPFSA